VNFVVHELVLLATKTKYGRRVNKWSMRVFGEEVARFSQRDLSMEAARIAQRAAQRDFAESVRLVEAFVIMEAKDIFESLAGKYPMLRTYHLDRGSMAEMIRKVMDRKGRSLESLRGLLVEALGRNIPETGELLDAMEFVRKRANKALKKKWSPARLVSGVRDGTERELGDLLVVSENADGRVWIMAIIESKSFSNVTDLSTHGDRKVGQHLWDWRRAKTRGVSFEGRHYKAQDVVIEPVPAAAWGGGAYVPKKKSAADRVREMSGYYTEFIGFAPQEMSVEKLGNLADQGIQLEYWPWPFDKNEFDRFQKDLTAAVDKALRR